MDAHNPAAYSLQLSTTIWKFKQFSNPW